MLYYKEFINANCFFKLGFPGSSESKESAHSVADPDLIPVSGRSPGEVNDNSLQYSCLENSMGRGTYQTPLFNSLRLLLLFLIV